MILKNITARTGVSRTGLLFSILIEIEDEERHIHRYTMDFDKGMTRNEIAQKVEDLARDVRDA